MVVFCNLLVDLFGLFRIYLLYEFSRDTGINTTRFDYGLTQNNRAGSYDSPFTDHCMVEYNLPHSDQGSVAYFGSMYRHIMPDRDIIADLYGRFLI